MVSNLAQRGIVLQTLHKYHSLAAQRKRLRDAGFIDGQRGADVEWIYEKWRDEVEKERVGKCEMLDEMEEWVLLGRHYAVVWGWRNGEPHSADESETFVEARDDLFGMAWESTKAQDDGGGGGG